MSLQSAKRQFDNWFKKVGVWRV